MPARSARFRDAAGGADRPRPDEAQPRRPDGRRVPAAKDRARGRAAGTLQRLLFEHSGVLPCDEIDPAYSHLIPLCREMRTAAGPVDLVYVTPMGKLVLVETKLWRNPQARREVVAQILDYAKELSRWEYEDPEREVIGASAGNRATIFERVNAENSALQEAAFCDQASRILRAGQFLLLIVGDGIREGVGGMTEFLDQFGSLQFSFGLVEVGVFEVPSGGSSSPASWQKRVITSLIRNNPYKFYDRLITCGAREFLSRQNKLVWFKSPGLEERRWIAPASLQDECELVFITITGTHLVLSRGRDLFDPSAEYRVRLRWS